MEVPLHVEGNWHGVVTSSLEIVSERQDASLEFEYSISKYSFVESMQSRQLGTFKVDVSELQAPVSKKYFFIAASHTLIPQFIQINRQ